MPSRWAPLVSNAIVAAVMIAACSSGEATTDASQPPTVSPTVSTDVTPDASPPTSTSTSTSTSTAPAPAETATDGDLCAELATSVGGSIGAAALTETSGLAASQRFDGVIWAHNDSGHEPGVYALAADGEPLGFHRLDGVDVDDPEDLALADGYLYLADIGDNDRQRDEVAIVRFPEPDPTGDAVVSGAERIVLRYPDGPVDAEALLVDPMSGELFILDKSLQLGGGTTGLISPAPAVVYRAPPLPDGFSSGAEPIELERVGSVPVDDLAEIATGTSGDDQLTDLGLDGLVTGADIRADGGAIAVRTYSSVWLYARSPGQSVAEALAGTPCEAPTAVEPQGEAVAFLDAAGSGFVTVSEGAGAPLNVTVAG